MSRFKQAVQTAMESFQDDVAESIDASQVTAPLYDVDTQLGELESNEVEIVRGTEDISALEATMIGLESVAQKLERAVRTGGLTPQESGWANMAITAHTDRVGLEHQGLGLESFGGTMTRVEATQITLESLSDRLKAMWEAIKAMVAKVWRSILKFFMDLTKSHKAMLRYADDLAAHLNQLQSAGKKASVDKVALGLRSAQALATNGPYVEIHGAKNMAERLSGEVIGLTNDMLKDQAMFQGIFKKLVLKAKDKADISQELGEMVHAITVLSVLKSGGRLFEKGHVKDGLETRNSKPLPGNVTLTCVNKNSEVSSDDPQVVLTTVLDILKSIQFRFVPIPGATAPSKDTLDVPVLPLADLQVIVRLVKGMCSNAVTLDKQISTLDREVGDNLRLLDGVYKNLIGRGVAQDAESVGYMHAYPGGELTVGDGTVQQATVMQVFSAGSTKMLTPVLLLSQYSVRVSRALLDVVHRQAAVYK